MFKNGYFYYLQLSLKEHGELAKINFDINFTAQAGLSMEIKCERRFYIMNE